MATTSRGSDSPIKTQNNALSFTEMRNWSRLTRGQSLQLSGIDFGCVTALQAAHREFIRNTAMSRDERADYEADRQLEFAVEITECAAAWDKRSSAELGPGLNAVMAAACGQIAPGACKDIELQWSDWIDDEDTTPTLHPDDQRVVWVPHFALPLHARFTSSGQPSRSWVYFSNYSATERSAYAARPPMYTWAPEDVVLTCIFEFLRRATENEYVKTSEITLAWRSQLLIQPEAYP